MSNTYKCTHWHYDEDDNQYELEALWLFEMNYPEMPDQWVLLGVELVEPCGVELDTSENSPVWNAVEKEGPDSHAEPYDDRDYDAEDLNYGQERF